MLTYSVSVWLRHYHSAELHCRLHYKQQIKGLPEYLLIFLELLSEKEK